MKFKNLGMDRNKRHALMISTLIGMVLYLAAALIGDLQRVVAILSRLGPWELTVIFGLSLVNYALRFLRWAWYTRRLGHVIPVGTNLAYYLAGFAFTVTPGKAGEAVRSVYLKDHGMGYTQSLATFFTERLLDLFTIVLLAGFAVVEFGGYRWFVIITAVVVFIGTWTVRHPAFLSRLEAYTGGKVNSRLAAIVATLSSSASLLRAEAFYGGLLLGVLAWGAEAIAFWFILDYLGVSASPVTAIGIYAVAVLAGALSFIPGGLGSTEAVMGLLLVVIGADAATAVAATLVCRVATLWFAVAIGVAVTVVLETRKWSQPSTTP